MNPYAALIAALRWHYEQFAQYAVVFVYDDYLRTRAVDRMDITLVAIRHEPKGVPELFRYMKKLEALVECNSEALEQMRAAIIAMPDGVWDEIAAGL